MQTQRTDLVQHVLDAVLALTANQAIFLPAESVVARSSTGKLRFGCGVGEVTWYKGDGETLLREHLDMMLNRKRGYYATHYANELRIESRYRPVNVQNVGRRSFHVVFEPSERALAAMMDLDCDHVDWVGRPYGALDAKCSDGRHLIINGAGEVKVAA